MPDSKRKSSHDLIYPAGWSRYSGLVSAFTTRSIGRESWFNLGYSVTRDSDAVTRNRKRLLRELGATSLQLLTLRQRHTDIVRPVRREDRKDLKGRKDTGGAWRLPGDAVVTDAPGLLLAVQVADCVPILLFEPRRCVVAAVHAGWRGTVKRITEKAVGVMRQQFGADPDRIRAAVGPSIRRCCYEVGREVVDAFTSQFGDGNDLVRTIEPSPHEVHWQQPVSALLRRGDDPRGSRRPRPAVTAPDATQYFLDLEAANRLQLEAAGIPGKNIWSAPHCTVCNTDRFFSHRAEHGKTGRQMGLVGILPDKAQAAELNRRDE